MFVDLFNTLATEYFGETIVLLVILAASLTIACQYTSPDSSLRLFFVFLVVLVLFLLFSFISFRDDLMEAKTLEYAQHTVCNIFGFNV